MSFLKPHHARLGMVIASLVGLFASTYLLYTYVSGAPIACGAIAGCEAVRASKWAYTFGIPRPLLGVIFYLAVLGLLIVRAASSWNPKWLFRFTVLAAIAGFVESAFLFGVQWLDIKAFCFWCLSSAIAATFIMIFALFDRADTERILPAQQELKRYFIALLIFLPLSVIGLYALIRYRPLSIPPVAIQDLTPEQVLLTPDTPVEGPATSTVLVVEFTDFQCPACGAFFPTMKKIREDYAGRIRFAYRHFPLTNIHDRALQAARAAYCAGKQDKLFAYGDVLFLNQKYLSDDDFIRYATGLSLNEAMFRSCFADQASLDAVKFDQAQALKLGLRFTPTTFVNRNKIDQALTYEELKTIIDQELAKK